VSLRLCDADLKATGVAHLVSGDSPEASNTFGEEQVGVRSEQVTGVSASFSYHLPRHSHVVLELELV
jgi:hypothetical protein